MASDREGGRVAIKFLHDWFVADERSVAALEREADVLAKLDHPNIAKPVLFGREEDLVYLAIEFVAGTSLEAIVGRHAESGVHLAIETVAAWFEQTCHGVIYAHLSGIVHRDLKPANVMILDEAGPCSVKVVDFGTAKVLQQSPERATTVGRIYGSPSYMSPEQARGEPATERSDVFALGVILFEMLALRRAWLWDDDRPAPAFVELPPRVRAQNHPNAVMGRITGAPRPCLSAHREEMKLLDRIVAQAMAIDPGERQPSVADLLEDVVPLLSEVEVRLGEATTEAIERDQEDTVQADEV